MPSVPWSFCGRVGRLFVSNEQLYRTIIPEEAEFYKNLFEQGVIQQLIKDGFFVESELVTDIPEDCNSYGHNQLLVRHRKLPFISYCFEWCDEMLKDAALFFITFNLRLLQFNLIVRDAHPWNIIFDNTRPLFVDLGSIVPVEKVDFSAFIQDFKRLFLNPLQLFSQGYPSMSHLFLREWRNNGWEDFTRLIQRRHSRFRQFFNVLKKNIPSGIRKSARSIIYRALPYLDPYRTYQEQVALGRSKKETIIDALEALKRETEQIHFQKDPRTGPDYYETYFSFPDFTCSDKWNAKQHSVSEVLDRVTPRSTLDIGSNRGWYSELAARKGSRVVTIDCEEAAIRTLYKSAKQGNLPILPLVMDFVWPSPACGVLEFWPSASVRFKADLVMALALVHHLVHLETMWFDHIINGLERFTSQWLLVEFVPYEDPLLSKWNSQRYSWYNLDQFLEELKKTFTVVEIKPSCPSQRTLILCEKK